MRCFDRRSSRRCRPWGSCRRSPCASRFSSSASGRWTLSATPWHRVRWMAILAVPLLLLTGFCGPAAAVISPTGRLPTAPTTFHTYASLVSELQNLSRAHPSLLTVTAIGSSWETTQGLANRSLFAAEVRVPGGTKKDVLFMGLHHAEEWISLEVVVYLLRYVLLNAGNDSRVDAILEIGRASCR